MAPRRAVEDCVSALDQLAKVGKSHQSLRQKLEVVRDELVPLIVEAARDGAGTAEIARLSGYTRDRVRTMLREAGIEPLSIGRPRKDRRAA
jgi:ribosomal 50S subunit-associated protein YjgA (DUF615 family)